MKKNKIILIVTITILVILIITGILLFIPKGNKENKEIIYLGMYRNNEKKDINIIKSYEQYKEYFDSDKVKESFFDNNYAVLEINFDECSESDLEVKDYEIKDNVIKANISYKASCGLCAPQYMYYLIPISKDMDKVDFDVKYKQINKIDCPQDVAYKPIIYLYPKKDTNVEVKLGNSDSLITTYPKYKNGWKVLAKSNGDLYDENGRYYYGLYWEGNNHKTEIKEDGFIVEGKDVEKFLEEKLKVLGLTEREADEFIIYWLPKLEENKYNYIRFETIEEINSYMPLEINPNSDTIIRILMDYKVLEKPISIKEQKLTTPKRKGFTVVEWGGSLIK